MTSQLDLFEQAEVARDEGMARVAAHADRTVQDILAHALELYLRTHEHYFADWFWTFYEAQELPVPDEMRSFGPIVQAAVRRGWMTPTGEARKSVRSHLSPKAVYRSNLYSDD